MEKGKRYQGDDLEKLMELTEQTEPRKKGWFWKVLLLSLVISALILAVACAVIFQKKKEQTDYLSKINESNTLELLLDGHSNLTITESYKGLKDADDHTATYFLKETEKDGLYAYVKTEGLEADYTEVLAGQTLYRYDGSFAYYYGLVDDDYDTVCQEIKGQILQLEGSERVEEQNESSEHMKVTLQHEVKGNDRYSKEYGLEAGTIVKKVLMIDKQSKIILSDHETVGDEEIYSYSVTFDGKNKVPSFYRKLKKKKTMRTCEVYFDYEGEAEKRYTFDVPVDAYFTLLEHEGYTAFMDDDCEEEFTTSQMQFQNPYNDMTLYLKKNK